MGFQVPITIADSIKRIRERRLLLPAIQRNFVWSHAKIEWLFDSLLQDYPIGSFLFWDVRDAQSKTDYKYYEFLREYREEYRTENPEFNTDGHADFDAVLDGQQRLTALYIGFCGSYAYYRGRVWWENTEHALPTRHLYLNLRDRAPEDEDQAGRVFEFKFLTEHEYKEESEKWFLVGRILELTNFTKFSQMLIAGGYQQNEFATDALSKLQESIHTKPLINYYRIENADMERALNVFVRVNSAEPLSLSDMLMSTAIAHWKIKDARKEIPALVNDIRSLGFFVDKDLILKTCLYLYSSDIRYRVSNFTAARVKPFEDNWDAIRASVLAVFTLIRDFGYSDKSLSSKNTLLPVIYWVHHRELAAGLTTQVGFRAERDSIRAWIHIMLLKGKRQRGGVLPARVRIWKMSSSFQQLERAMQKIKQRRYRAETWQKILGRFEESGLTESAFCAREGISTQSLQRWRLRLGGESGHSLVAKATQLTRKTDDDEFIDLGALRSAESRFEVRLELGAGLILSIARG
jgi:Protein of unknown function DUF262